MMTIEHKRSVLDTVFSFPFFFFFLKILEEILRETVEGNRSFRIRMRY